MELIVRSYEEGNIKDQLYQYHEIESLASAKSSSKQIREVVFVTGNKNKVAELEEFMKPKLVNFSVAKLDLVEIQDSNPLKIVEDKCHKAFREINQTIDGGIPKCVLIDDCSLHFNALNGMPGPYCKWFLDAVGPEGMYKMLVGFEDKTASAVCTYALMESESRLVFCKGFVRGKITSPRGGSWGWDPIFEEERTGNTFGEMNKDTKSKFSHRANAITVLRKYLATVH